VSTKRKSLSFHRRSGPGAIPGTLTAPRNAAATRIDVVAYSDEELFEEADTSLERVAELRGQYKVLWIDISGLSDVSAIEQLGEHFNLHRLALEDVFNVHQRPKCDEFDDHLFLVARMAERGKHLETEQLVAFLGKDFLITVQEHPGDCFDPIRKRIKDKRGRIRRAGNDYLFYALLDAIIDDYFPVLEELGDTLDAIEDRVIAKPHPQHVRELHDLKRDLLVLRRAVWPHREMINSILRDENQLFEERTRLYLRDGYDHTIQLMDIIETYREIASGLVDVYISSMSAKLNEIMKVLTVIATIFMPLGFIASYFGMNFDTKSPWNMPELGWRFGYIYAVVLMLLSAAGMLWYFARNGWIDLNRNKSTKEIASTAADDSVGQKRPPNDRPG
jgi:magnesium transporter